MSKIAVAVLTALAPLMACAATETEIVEVGNARYYFDKDRRFGSLFGSTLIFGHSISSGLMKKVFLGGVYGEGPGTVLARNYANAEPVGNLAEAFGTMETGLGKMYRWVHQVEDDECPGPHCVEGRKLETMNSLFDRAKVIVGVDALYMAVAFDECRDYPNGELTATIDAFVEKSYRAGKVLILANVPKEDWNSVTPLANLVLKHENESCRKQMNLVLENVCKSDRNCYLVDLEGIVAGINSTKQYKLQDGTILRADKFYVYNEIRPDGINLSPRGVQIVVEDILKQLNMRPPHNSSGQNAPAAQPEGLILR